MNIEDLEKELQAREKMYVNTYAILHQLEGQLALLRDLIKKEEVPPEKQE